MQKNEKIENIDLDLLKLALSDIKQRSESKINPKLIFVGEYIVAKNEEIIQSEEKTIITELIVDFIQFCTKSSTIPSNCVQYFMLIHSLIQGYVQTINEFQDPKKAEFVLQEMKKLSISIFESIHVQEDDITNCFQEYIFAVKAQRIYENKDFLGNINSLDDILYHRFKPFLQNTNLKNDLHKIQMDILILTKYLSQIEDYYVAKEESKILENTENSTRAKLLLHKLLEVSQSFKIDRKLYKYENSNFIEKKKQRNEAQLEFLIEEEKQLLSEIQQIEDARSREFSEPDSEYSIKMGKLRSLSKAVLEERGRTLHQ